MATAKSPLSVALVYRIVVELSSREAGYVATVPAFKDLMATGGTAEEAVTHAQAAAFRRIKWLEDRGMPVPTPDSAADYSGQFRLRLPRAMHMDLSRMAEDECVSLNTLAVVLIAEALGWRRGRRGRRAPTKPRGGS